MRQAGGGLTACPRRRRPGPAAEVSDPALVGGRAWRRSAPAAAQVAARAPKYGVAVGRAWTATRPPARTHGERLTALHDLLQTGAPGDDGGQLPDDHSSNGRTNDPEQSRRGGAVALPPAPDARWIRRHGHWSRRGEVAASRDSPRAVAPVRRSRNLYYIRSSAGLDHSRGLQGRVPAPALVIFTSVSDLVCGVVRAGCPVSLGGAGSTGRGLLGRGWGRGSGRWR